MNDLRRLCATCGCPRWKHAIFPNKQCDEFVEKTRALNTDDMNVQGISGFTAKYLVTPINNYVSHDEKDALNIGHVCMNIHGYIEAAIAYGFDEHAILTHVSHICAQYAASTGAEDA